MLLILCLLLVVILIYLTEYAYAMVCPNKIFSYFWGIQILVLLIGGYGFLLFKYTGVIFILICLLCFNLAPLVMRGKISYKEFVEIENYIYVDNRKLLYVLIVFTLLGFYNPIQMIITHGFNLSSLLDFATLLKVNNSLSVSRYTEHNSAGLFTQIFLIFSYVSPLLGGFSYVFFLQRKSKIFCLITLTPLLFAGLTQGVKMGIITSVILFIAGYYVASTLVGNNIVIKFKTILYGLLGAVLLILVLLVSMMFRIGKFDMSTFNVVTDKFIAYALGHLPAFDIWFDKQIWVPDSLTYGAKMFAGISNFLGILKREQGLYLDFTTISTGGSVTNVYTIFRVFIDDFGVILSPLLFFFMGMFIQYSYVNLRRLLHYRLNSTICVAFIFMSLWSFGTSVFVYTSYICMLLLFYGVLCFCTKKISYEEIA